MQRAARNSRIKKIGGRWYHAVPKFFGLSLVSFIFVLVGSPAAMHILAGNTGIVPALTVGRAAMVANKPVAVGRFLSVHFDEEMVLTEPFAAPSVQASLAAHCAYFSAGLAQWSLLMAAGYDDNRRVCQTEPILLHAVD